MTDRTEALIRSLTESGLTLGVAESLTGGALCSELIRPAGASAVVLGGVVAYATPVKASVLHVEHELLAAEGPVHPQVAAEMASGVRDALAVNGVRADIGVSTTGVAGPDAQGGHPPGTVYVAVSSDRGSAVRDLLLSGDRSQIRCGAVEAAIDLLFDTVLQIDSRGE